MEFRILGPLEASRAGETLDLGGPKQRALLALLLLGPNRVVPRDTLIAALWDDAPPDTARKALQVYVSGLRKAIGKERLVTRSPGYLLRVEAGELDLDRFEHLRSEGELDEALALWRGAPLADFARERFAQSEIARLEELRLAVLEERIERGLAEGRHRELVPELDALAGEHPLRERIRAQQMLARYRAGRQADALDAYREARDALVDELGIEPGRELRDLQQAILNQDPALDLASVDESRRRTAAPASPASPVSPGTLPSGTVTLLFADIESSTRLLRDLGERFPTVRSRARELVREAVAAHAGHEVDWAGDGVFLAFERASGAVAAAAALQRSLSSEPWPPDVTVRMRIGIHTGEPEVGPDGYVGLDVHLAARICTAAHGGQVVVSRSTRDVVGDDLPAGVAFRPLGRHRLKDIPFQEALFQLTAPGLQQTFPPLQALGGPALPALHHRLVGREGDLARLRELLARQEIRLVTITGPGGAGKSRLALETAGAASVERSVHLVGLASISDPELVPAAIARSLGVQEAPGQPLLETIADALGDTATLLVLDNLEHLAPAASTVTTLLDLVPDLDVLATSRAPLHLAGEHVLQLEPLPVDDATTLFLELAAARGVQLEDEWLPAVREICRRLDGLPLAIELVVAPLAVLPPVQLLQALDDGLVLDMKAPFDLPERQRTLRATIEWSYGLVSACQRDLHGALAVFRGGAPLDALQVVCDDLTADLLGDLTGLVESGLVRRDTTFGSSPRFAMLATVREYALETLTARGRLDDMRTMHAEYYLELTRQAESGLEGEEQAAWLDRLELDLDNIRAALGFSLESDRVELGLGIASSLTRFWRAHAYVGEARRWLEIGLSRGDGLPHGARADALSAAAQQAFAQSDWVAAEPLLEEARELYRESGQSRKEVFALAYLSFAAMRRDEIERAERFAEEAVAIAAELDDDRASSGALIVLADIQSWQGRHELALARYEEAVALRTRLGDTLLITDAVYNLGLAAFHAGDLVRAAREFENALARARELGDTSYIAAAQLMLAEIALAAREDAAPPARESLTLYTTLGDDRSRARCLLVLAAAACARGDDEVAARLLGAAETARGDDPMDEFESPVLERFLPELESRLGAATLEQWIAEGRRDGSDAVARDIVTLTTKA